MGIANGHRTIPVKQKTLVCQTHVTEMARVLWLVTMVTNVTVVHLPAQIAKLILVFQTYVRMMVCVYWMVLEVTHATAMNSQDQTAKLIPVIQAHVEMEERVPEMAKVDTNVPA